MFRVPVCCSPCNEGGHIFPFVPGQPAAKVAWQVRDILSFLSQVTPQHSVRRINPKEEAFYKYSVETTVKRYLVVVFSKDLTQGAIELIDPSCLPAPVIMSNNGINWNLYIFCRFMRGWVGDMKEIPILSSLFKSFRQICRNDPNSMRLVRLLFELGEKRPGFERGLSVSSQFQEFLNGHTGYFHLQLDNNFANISGKTERMPFTYEENGTKFRVVAMSWLCPTVVDVLRNFSYCELDATFFAMKPYVMCVPQFIRNNCAYPVGLILAPSESESLYGLFYDTLTHALHGAGFAGRPRFSILSDGGGALRSFCAGHGLPQFQCHRHLIEWFGANSILKTVFLKLLRSRNAEEFTTNLSLANGVFLELYRRGEVDAKVREKYLWFTGQVFNDERDQLQPGPGQIARVQEWAIWCRGTITTCSNHAESFHRVLKNAVKPNGRHLGVGKSLFECAAAILTRQSQWKASFSRNIKAYIRYQDDTPVDFEYVREVARRFEIQMPSDIDPATPEREVIEGLLRNGEAAIAPITLMSPDVHSITHSRWIGKDFGHQEKEKTDRIRPPDPFLTDVVERDTRVQVARDLWASLGDRRRPDLYPWVFHWTQQALESQEIDPKAEPVRAYIACWDFIQDKLRTVRE